MAQEGNVEAAHGHRERVMANGGAPSANTHGVLILYTKAITDGQHLNFSYSIPKCRGAECGAQSRQHHLQTCEVSENDALELFNRMKSQNI